LLKIDLDNQFSAEARRLFKPRITFGPYTSFDYSSIPVEVEKKGDRASFVELFNVYGFSGNGPSIEQVVKANIQARNLRYDSEGDAFFVHVPDQETYLQVLKELEAVTRIESLNVWLRNAVWIPIKE
jgi:hypothetical protein